MQSRRRNSGCSAVLQVTALAHLAGACSVPLAGHSSGVSPPTDAIQHHNSGNTGMTHIENNHIVGSGGGAKSSPEKTAGEEYWTPERRAAAKPVPMPQVPQGKTAPEIVRPEGEPGRLEPGRPEREHEEPLSATPGGHPVANPLAYPYRACGKIFFTQAGGGYAGSAALISRNVLLTAGHCVYSGGWSSNFTFYPSYPLRPTLHFSSVHLAAWTAWTQNGNKAFDYGLAWIDNNPGDQIGWLGLLWNASTSGRVWDAVGYPATPNPPFSGNTMDESLGTAAASSVSGTIGLTNDNMEHGSSGGPWITDFNGSPREYANGLQSFHNHDGDLVEYGPYFTADVKKLVDWISNPANRH